MSLLIPMVTGCISMTYWGMTLHALPNICITAGVVWAGIILLFDRGILVTLKPRTWKRNGTLLVLRIGAAFLIGYVITKPIELLVFKERIEQKLSENLRKEEKNLTAGRDAKLQVQNDELLRYEDEVNESEQEFRSEVDNKIGGRSTGYGNVAKLKESKWYEKKNDLIGKQYRIDSIKTAISLETADDLKALRSKYSTDLLSRAQALKEIEHDDPWHIVSILSWAITLLFMCLELAPLIMKLSKLSNGMDEYQMRLEINTSAIKQQHADEVRLTPEELRENDAEVEKERFAYVQTVLKRIEQLSKKVAKTDRHIASLQTEEFKQPFINRIASLLAELDSNTIR